jgi:membrane peptidoglycan carboxypeptidase
MRKITTLILAILLIASVIYSVLIVIDAKSYTDKVIKPDLMENQWRIKNQVPHKFLLNINDFTDKQQKILLSVQDPAFYEHNGMDLSTPGAGLTTISQSIVKKLYFERFKKGFAKFKQTIIAIFVVDSDIEKKQQLNIFINSAYMGQSANNKPIYGFEEAAQYYFKKPFSALNNSEYLSLVAMLIAPNTFSIEKYPEKNRQRVDRILNLLSGAYTPKSLTDVYYDQ